MVECDELPKDEQWEKIRGLGLPVQSVVWSGGKSLHTLVKIDAGTDQDLYKKRVAALYTFLERNGFPADPANKNSSRLTRVPGVYRGDDMQYLVAGSFGSPDWTFFERHMLNARTTAAGTRDRRSVTSAINGLQGGRPPLPVTDFAAEYLEANSLDREPLLHFWRGDWWRYCRQTWKVEPVADLRTSVTGFLQEHNLQAQTVITDNLIKNILINLQGLCGLCGVQMPCWLPSGESAENVLAFTNGLINLDALIDNPETKLQPLTPKYFGSNKVEYAFEPDATCPMWDEYLQTTFDCDEDREMLQMLFGYILSGKTDMNVGFFLLGPGGDGKSVTAHVLKQLVGEQQTSCLPFSDLDSKFGAYLLTERSLNLVEELPVTTEAGASCLARAEKTFKTVTDAALIQVERKYHDPYQAQARARCVFCTNSMPSFVDRSNGLWDRIVILPYPHRFRGTSQEKKSLRTDLEKELSGIFLWAVEGARKLKGLTRFPLSPNAQQAVAEHRKTCDKELMFLNEVVVAGEGDFEERTIVGRATLYTEYQRWCESFGYRAYAAGRFKSSVTLDLPAYEDRLRKSGIDQQIWGGIHWITPRKTWQQL